MNFNVSNLIIIFSIIFFRLLSPTNLHAETYYNGYSNHVIGSRDIIGMGGAYVSIADGITNTWINPAGISSLEDSWEWGFGYGATHTSETFLDGNYTLKTKDLTYLYFGIVDKVESWRNFGYGFVVDSPSKQIADAKRGDETINYELQNIAFSVPLSISATKNLHFGLSLQIHLSDNRVTISGPNPSVQEKTTFTSGSVLAGFIYEYYDWRFGGSVSPQKILRLQKNQTQKTINGLAAFKETSVPSVFQLGVSRKLSLFKRAFIFSSDVRVAFGVKNTVLPASDLVTDSSGVPIRNSASVQYHIGTKTETHDGRWEFRLGHYIQPSRHSGGTIRFHGTGSIEYFFWYLNIGLAADFANGYYLISFSIFPSWKLANLRAKRGQ